MIEIQPEMPARDAEAIEALYDRTFGPGHFAKTAERVRETSRSLPSLSRVARHGDAVIGVCRVWPIRVVPTGIGNVAQAHRALFYGPVAVDPAYQGDGLGLVITQAALEAGQSAGWEAAVLIGAPDYFGRIGFKPVAAGQLVFPGPQDASRIMVVSLAGEGSAITGRVEAAPDLA
ncbi:MAG: N-acetyltransferase [Pseudomonadota bacterium]